MRSKRIGRLNWISKHDILSDDYASIHIPTHIKGIVSFKNENSVCCEDVIFINKKIYKSYSPFFSYTLKTNKEHKCYINYNQALYCCYKII